jgi:gliding motility-associated lipoprotein GldH
MTRGIRVTKSILILIAGSLIFLLSCKNNILFTDSAEMPGSTWNLSNTPEFKVEITDTINRSNVFFTIRTGTDYSFRNIWLFATTTSPDGKKILTDTLEYELADEKGNWYGKGFGDIHELILPYRTNVFFPRKGVYIFKIQHGMRAGDLKGVYDIGLRIEKYQQ